MAYSIAKLKSIGDRASPCFKPFLIGNLSDTFLPTWTLLYVSIRLIFINLTSFLGIPNSMRILYKISLLTESQAFFKSMKSWWISAWFNVLKLFSLCSHRKNLLGIKVMGTTTTTMTTNHHHHHHHQFCDDDDDDKIMVMRMKWWWWSSSS